MADNKRFTVKTGLQAQDLYLESPNKTKNITVSMLNTGVMSFNTNSNQIFTVSESGTATLGGRTITLGGDISTANSFTTAGNFATTLTTTAATNVTLPTSGTLMTTGGSGATGTWSISINGNANTVTDGVYTTGNQTIGGVKTFSANSVFNDRVGIGVTSPVNKVHISATPPTTVPLAGVTGHAFGLGTNPYGLAAGVISDGTSYLQSTRWDGTATNYNIAIQPNGGNVGIGTIAPSRPLHVVTTGATISAALLQNDTGDTAVFTRSQDTGTNTLYFGDTTNFQSGFVQYAHASDLMISRSAGAIVLQTGGANERMRIDSAGNVGVGVAPSAWGIGGRAVEFGPGNALFSGTAGFTPFYLTNNTYFDGTSWVYKNTQTATLYAQNFGYHQWFRAPSGTAGNQITFTQAMTLDTNGNLVVGSTTANRANVNQSISVEGATTSILESNINGSRAGYIYSDATRTVVGEFRTGPLSFRTSDTDRLQIDATGVVTIPGLTTETKSLEIGMGRAGDGISHIDLVGDATYGDFGARIIRNGGVNANTQIQHRGTGGLRLEAADEAPIVFSTTNTDKMQISANGNVGIGTSAPIQKLEVVGNIYLNGADAQGIIMNGGNAIVRASSGISIRTGNSLEKIRIDAGGQVGIGINVPTAKLHVVGSTRVTEEVYGKVLFSTGGMILNSRVISNSYTVIANNNAMSTGPIEIANGVTITISDGARWVVM